MKKPYTEATCPNCSKPLFSTIPPWEQKKGQKIIADTCIDCGKVA